MANENGIAIFIDPSLGLARAGRMWLQLPESGFPADALDLYYGSYVVSRSLCTRQQFDVHHDIRSLSVDSPDWAGVERKIDELRAESEKKAAAKAAEDLARAVTKSRVDAAIANPEPSDLLTRDESHPWSPWDFCCSGIPSSVGCGALQNETTRRNRAANEEWNALLAQMDDDQFVLSCGGHPRESQINPDNKSRLRTIRAARDAAQNAAKTAEVTAAFAKANAPSHVTERFVAGVLPNSERDEWLSTAAFGAITLPAFVWLTDADLPEHGEDCQEPEVKFSGAEYEGELDADEWASWKSVKAALESAGFEPELRFSKVYCSDNSCCACAYRLKARVTATIGGVTVTQEYAV